MKKRRSRLTKSEGVTQYRKLYDVLSKSLKSRRAKSRLPSEPQLVKRYNISRTTARRALLMLEREGRIRRVQGSGTFAA